MYAKAKIAGHPIHPMLVAFPIAFYVGTLVAFVVYWIDRDPFWFHIGVVANVVGLVTALLAAVPGLIDWGIGIPTGSPAKLVGVRHMLLQLSSLVLFAISLALEGPKWHLAAPSVGASVIIPALGVLATMLGARLGWRLIAKYHVGIDLTPEQQRLEPLPDPDAHQVWDALPPPPAPPGAHPPAYPSR